MSDAENALISGDGSEVGRIHEGAPRAPDAHAAAHLTSEAWGNGEGSGGREERGLKRNKEWLIENRYNKDAK